VTRWLRKWPGLPLPNSLGSNPHIATLNAVDNLDEIQEVPGIDAVFMGSEDLAAPQGMLGRKSDPRNLAAIDRILQKGQERVVPVGIYGMVPEMMKDHIDRGFKFVTTGSDMSFLQVGLRDVLKRIGRS
jgi:4-hydroxy-2-oxoheptanedioate aldolase